MNRRQRRTRSGQHAHMEMVDLRKVVMPPDMTLDECQMIAQDRITTNYLQTKHPYHHLTANGAIVDADPTLEYLIQRLEDDANYRNRAEGIKAGAGQLIEAATALQKTIPTAIPVNRRYYGIDPFEGLVQGKKGRQ